MWSHNTDLEIGEGAAGAGWSTMNTTVDNPIVKFVWLLTTVEAGGCYWAMCQEEEENTDIGDHLWSPNQGW